MIVVGWNGWVKTKTFKRIEKTQKQPTIIPITYLFKEYVSDLCMYGAYHTIVNDAGTNYAIDYY